MARFTVCLGGRLGADEAGEGAPQPTSLLGPGAEDGGRSGLRVTGCGCGRGWVSGEGCTSW